MNEYLMKHLLQMYHDIDQLLTHESHSSGTIERQVSDTHPSEPLYLSWKNPKNNYVGDQATHSRG